MKRLESDLAFSLLGARSMNERLETMRSLIPAVRINEDVEAVHKMRVASRRLRAAMNLFDGCLPRKQATTWRKEVRHVTRALGSARDIDVQILFVEEFLDGLGNARLAPGIRRLLLRLRQGRERQQKKVDAAMDRAESSALFTKMSRTLRGILVRGRLEDTSTVSDPLLNYARTTIRRCLGELLSYESAVLWPERIEELHSMRIAAKRLRYSMEIFAPLYGGTLADTLKTTRRLQTLLGDIHDCDVWIDLMPEFTEKELRRTREYFGSSRAFRRIRPGLDHLASERRDRRGKLYDRFVKLWQSLEAERTWESLSDILNRGAGERDGGDATEAEAVAPATGEIDGVQEPQEPGPDSD